ncbi:MULTISPECIES: hypothetical protein [Pseudoalteromonas]|nr:MULTISPECIES: hypothetical protein [Pseudoalteromonas]MCO7201884.1 hypothetical protein [Pseudoalteromonas sp. OANN1]
MMYLQSCGAYIANKAQEGASFNFIADALAEGKTQQLVIANESFYRGE